MRGKQCFQSIPSLLCCSRPITSLLLIVVVLAVVGIVDGKDQSLDKYQPVDEDKAAVRFFFFAFFWWHFPVC